MPISFSKTGCASMANETLHCSPDRPFNTDMGLNYLMIVVSLLPGCKAHSFRLTTTVWLDYLGLVCVLMSAAGLLISSALCK
jgi:hypothetical protein